ncbi:Arginine/alanine aminopeptidase, overproduction stimulates glycogen accumulation [Planoprotostelium fungivorum]|uniref:Arginine/alanine aminopeptidase, overproduction stimulates glycogen accumulation n=1 Tax=Planoprotostelium fungivorum TaxID=1890364 RepID=A0A2P6NZQ7_9EUKA|nr:Arginine/alanine aminopeptidase, overproduction stimulates glycogen accumulation [Planoprotostelium fungivorum]
MSNRKKKGQMMEEAPVVTQQGPSSHEPSRWKPLQYALSLSFDSTSSNTYNGSLSLSIECVEEVKSFVLDFYTIEGKIIEVSAIQNKLKPTAKCHELPGGRQIQINLQEAIKPGRAVLNFRFRGTIRTDGLGLYKSQSTSAWTLLCTHFEPNFASLCFPCIDDASARASFILSIQVPPDMTVHAGMPLKHSPSTKNELLSFEFEESPRIPPYLFAFAVGRFIVVEATFSSVCENTLSPLGGEISTNIPIRAMVSIDHYNEKMRRDILDRLIIAGSQSLHACEKFLGIPFWLPKIDLLALPVMLLAGMENVGLCFLHVKEEGDPSEALSSAETDVLHEIAHQWVGNLVGMSLRVKEGIVQYIEKQLSEKLFGSQKKSSGRKKAGQVKSMTNKKTQGNSTESQLQRDFCKELNEEFYQKSLKAVETAVDVMGEKTFQTRLASVLNEYALSYLPDEVAHERILRLP